MVDAQFLQAFAAFCSLEEEGGEDEGWGAAMCTHTLGCYVAVAPLSAQTKLVLHFLHAAGFDEDEEDEEDEGWGVVQAPFLPPPPSQPDAVEHWARAMFDQRGGAAAGQTQPYYAAAGGGAAAAAAASRGLAAVALGSSPGSSAGGMMSMERIRSMFGRGE